MSLKRFRERNSRSIVQTVNSQNNLRERVMGRILYEAVVLEFFSNPEVDLQKIGPGENETRTVEQIFSEGEYRVHNYQSLPRMPRGSIIAQVVSDREGWGGMRPEIFYPMFPHMFFPVKPGEKIWVMYETLNREKSSRGHWICRISAPLDVDDLNYTHIDRESIYRLITTNEDSTMASHSGESEDENLFENEVFGFPPGGGINQTGQTFGKPHDFYNTIVQNSLAYTDQFVGMPVPRFSPGLGDLILQGSHNTLISLGRDSAFNQSESLSSTMSGSIDIVSGRGMTYLTSAISNANVESRGDNLKPYEEINKFPQYGDNPEDSNDFEGYLDFIHDAARVYVSMLTNGDENFGLSFNYASQVADSSYVIAKANEVRLVGRGSVRAKSEAGAELTLMSSGEAAIIGDRVFLGSPAYTHGDTGHYHIVIGEKLLSAVEEFCQNLSLNLASAVDGTGTPLVFTPPTAIETLCNKFVEDVGKSFSDIVHTE